ncbi:MAG: caspase-like domain-containing protein [Xanthobacteraceae bacterium]|nr:MAG: caspase-like domain-containing protein [Xanthobacteraceae bacterium]
MLTRLFRQSRALVAGAMAVIGLLLLPGLAPADAQDQPAAPPQPRIAFVAGASNYEKGPLKTSLNDAGLIAESLRGLGFEVYEGADLSQTDLMRGIRDFVGRVDAAGPEAWAFVYISGYGTEFEGENYLFGADARFARPSDIPLEAVRLGDLLRPLASARGRARLVVLDVSRQLPGFERNLATRGLGLVEPAEGMLLAYSSAPETVAPPDAGNENYGAYATALAEMMRTPGLTLDDMFARVRARTHQLTQGRQTPWHAAGSLAGFVLDQGDPQAAAPPPPPPRMAAAAGRSLRDMGPEDAYAMVIERDALPGYVEYASIYPDSPYAARVRAIIQVRREALAWWRALRSNSPQGYWAYLQRYPNGRHAFEASRRLGLLSAPPAPPPGFVSDIYDDLPPPLPGEFYEDVVVYEVDAPPPPAFLIAPPPPYWRLPPPPPPRAPGFLPMPRPIAVPGWRPRYHNPAPPPPPVALPVRPGQPGTRPPGPPRGPEGTIAPPPRGTTIAPSGPPPRPEGRVPPGSRPQPGVVQPGAAQPGAKPAPGTVAPQQGTIAPQPGAKPGTQPPSVQPGARQPGARPGQPPGVVKPDTGARPEGRPRPGATVTPPAGPPPSRNVAPPPPSRPTVAPPPPKPAPQVAPPPRATVTPPPPRPTVAPPPPPRPSVAAPPPPRPAQVAPPPRPTPPPQAAPPPRPTVAAPPPQRPPPPPQQRPAKEGCKPTPQNPNACK